MIEQVAQAIAVKQGNSRRWMAYRTEAIAAIEAMREPTDVMVAVVSSGTTCVNNPSEAKVIWRMMIDAALRDRHTR